MAIYKCKMCGGDLDVTEGVNVVECDYCGTNQTVPYADNEKKVNLFNRANRLRIANEFDKAAGIYESIAAEFPEEAEAYWGICLCKYGIEYVDDPKTAKKIPTCHRTSFESIFNDGNFELALEYADPVAVSIYRNEAKEIDRIQKSILEIANKEEPFDIFICYKETGDDGQRTKDSVLAQDMYEALVQKGYKVFFSRITLEDKLGQEYEPYIFSALNSARVMLAVGTKYEYYNAVWVKNEWNRFLDLMKNNKTKVLIPCYADIDAYDMPQEFKNLQGQDMGKIGFIQDLVRGIGKIIAVNNVGSDQAVQAASSEKKLEMLLKRAFVFLDDGEWESAKEYCNKALDIDLECGKAYLGMLLADIKNKDILSIRNVDSFDELKVIKWCAKLKKYAPDILMEIEYKIDRKISYEIRERAFSCNKDLKSIDIPEGVTSIGKKAFQECEKLLSINIPDSVVSIGVQAFNKCKSLKSLTIPGNVTSIGYGAFSNCESLRTVTILNGVTSIGSNMFSSCRFLGSVSIPESVTSIGDSAFSRCDSLSSINIPESVTSIGSHAFAYCPLKSINIPESVTSIGDSAFDKCWYMQSINIPNSFLSRITNGFPANFYKDINIRCRNVPLPIIQTEENNADPENQENKSMLKRSCTLIFVVEKQKKFFDESDGRLIYFIIDNNETVIVGLNKGLSQSSVKVCPGKHFIQIRTIYKHSETDRIGGTEFKDTYSSDTIKGECTVDICENETLYLVTKRPNSFKKAKFVVKKTL